MTLKIEPIPRSQWAGLRCLVSTNPQDPAAPCYWARWGEDGVLHMDDPDAPDNLNVVQPGDSHTITKFTFEPDDE